MSYVTGIKNPKPGSFGILAAFLLVNLLFSCSPLRQMQPNIANGGRGVAIAPHPADDNKLIVASETGGLFRTVNKGSTWSHVSGSTTFFYKDVAYVPSNPAIVIAAADDDFKNPTGGGIWRSTSSGTNWIQVALAPPLPACAANFAVYSLEVDQNTGRIWAGTLCGLAYSNDNGGTWQFLPPASGYNHDKTYAVIASDTANLKILTDAGVKVTTNGGSSWSLSNAGLPANISKGVHNQLAVSPFDSNHIYWAFNFWRWNAETERWDGRWALYQSLDNGRNWTGILDEPGVNRPPFVRIARSLAGANRYDIYYSNGGCTFQRATATHGTTPAISSWTGLTVDHCDHTDVAFSTDTKTPILLVSDGGVHVTANNGLNWNYPASGKTGYAALQITEVTGQLHNGGSGADLYFATQDNDIWASPDYGANWTARRCCEGFFLNISRSYLPPDQTKLTGVSCAGCGNFISGPVLASQAGFPNPPNDNGNPKLLKPSHYIQNTRIPGLPGNVFNLTTNNGSTWTPRYGFPEDIRALSKSAGSAENPIVFTVVKNSGATPTGEEVLGLKRIVDVLGTGTPVVSDVTGFGSIGIFPTMFAWYKPFGVSIRNPNFLLVPDIIDEEVKKTVDGGTAWVTDAALKALVTMGGSMNFRENAFTQITTIEFDPECSTHILVGTRQAGILESYNSGNTWERVAGSEVIPLISSFFFAGNREVIISSYGRGLWKYKYKSCPARQIRPIPEFQLKRPLIYYMGVYVPLDDIGNPEICPVCGFFLVRNGYILDYRLDEQTKQVKEVTISGGLIEGFTYDRKAIALPFEVKTVRAGEAGRAIKELNLNQQELKNIRGLYLEKDVFKGVILSQQDVTTNELPRKKELGPYLQVELPNNNSIYVNSNEAIKVTGFNFNPQYPLEVYVDGSLIELAEGQKPQFNDNGIFVFFIPPFFNVGGHTIMVRQQTDRGLLQDLVNFHITVHDSK